MTDGHLALIFLLGLCLIIIGTLLPDHNDKFTEQCTKDNGVVIKAYKLVCVKQSAVLEQEK